MRWLVETVGNLHGQTARRRKLGEEPRKQGSVVRYPLQRSIGQNHVESPRAAPRRDSSISKLMVGSRFSAASIISGELSRPTIVASGNCVLEKFRRIAGAASDVGGVGHHLVGDLGDQIFDRAAPFRFELAVLGGRPTHHSAPFATTHAFRAYIRRRAGDPSSRRYTLSLVLIMLI